MSETGYRAGRKIQKTKEAAGLTLVVSPSAPCPVEPSDAQLAVVAPTGPRFSLVSGILASSNPNVKRSTRKSTRRNKRKILETGVKTRSGAKKLRYYWDFEFNSNYLITEDAASTAHLFRHFRKLGCRLPSFNRLAQEDNENYHSFATCWAGSSFLTLIAASNRTIDSYERRLQSVPPPVDPSETNATTTALNAELENLCAAATESAEAVKLSEERLTRSELGEIKAKYKLLFDSRRDAIRRPLVMVSEMKANYELLEEIVKGETVDFQAELESVEAKEKLSEAEVRIPPLDLSLLERLVSGSTLGPETAVEFISSILPFNQFGTNAGVLLGEI
ncbi:unnamed protein product [Arabis nemorensis]|uniref:Uncharacterized protein n=1 Tax=Arabis nemorensis TaxID=586526 RepID=A0A565BS99_9BRAS|nr:unnamed protein product [Arabis nemorensis]